MKFLIECISYNINYSLSWDLDVIFNKTYYFLNMSFVQMFRPKKDGQ